MNLLHILKYYLQENNRTVCNLQFEEKIEAIRLLTVYAEETQSQYNECFAEVQQTLLSIINFINLLRI